MAIQRQLTNERMSQIVAHNGTVYLSGQVGDDMNAGVEQQTRETLANIEHLLDLAGTDKSRILSVTIYLKDIDADFAGSINRLNIAIINWLQTHQPDILGPGAADPDAYVFEVDILSGGSCDIAIVLRLTESIRALVDDAGQIHISHRPPPQHKNDLTWPLLPDKIQEAQP